MESYSAIDHAREMCARNQRGEVFRIRSGERGLQSASRKEQIRPDAKLREIRIGLHFAAGRSQASVVQEYQDSGGRQLVDSRWWIVYSCRALCCAGIVFDQLAGNAVEELGDFVACGISGDGEGKIGFGSGPHDEVVQGVRTRMGYRVPSSPTAFVNSPAHGII